MGRELISTWLKIPSDPWPPDHYTLLELPRGESDTARIERHANNRMERLRVYQLAYPEEVTEAMNRLAQAFDCLRNAESRKAYDATLAGNAPPAPVSPPAVNRKTDVNLKPAAKSGTIPKLIDVPSKPPPPSAKEPIGWVQGSWNQPKPGAESEPITVDPKVGRATMESSALSPPEPGATASENPSSYARVLDPALEATRSRVARRGLGTKRAIYQRISRARHLIRAWVQVGEYLGDAKVQLANKAEALDLVRQLTIIRQQLADFPPIIGQAGQPGYLVIALARQPEIIKTFKSIPPTERKAYIRDWQQGLAVLAAYRLVLREELWALRRQGRVGRMGRAFRAIFTDTPLLWLTVLAAAALNIALPQVRALWAVQLGLAAVAIAIAFYQTSSRRQSFHRTRRRPPKTGTA